MKLHTILRDPIFRKTYDTHGGFDRSKLLRNINALAQSRKLSNRARAELQTLVDVRTMKEFRKGMRLLAKRIASYIKESKNRSYALLVQKSTFPSSENIKSNVWLLQPFVDLLKTYGLPHPVAIINLDSKKLKDKIKEARSKNVDCFIFVDDGIYSGDQMEGALDRFCSIAPCKPELLLGTVYGRSEALRKFSSYAFSPYGQCARVLLFTPFSYGYLNKSSGDMERNAYSPKRQKLYNRYVLHPAPFSENTMKEFEESGFTDKRVSWRGTVPRPPSVILPHKIPDIYSFYPSEVFSQLTNKYQPVYKTHYLGSG